LEGGFLQRAASACYSGSVAAKAATGPDADQEACSIAVRPGSSAIGQLPPEP
jgi:hypothetical protein